ncbi:hypothetical protein [Ferruginibacter sp. HRS2-29]|uniref:hypothetical protein n=1 Tax=Ferruginibacter sp. HRS2-29 TaxID=2487334 RepID=UPI0020CBDDF1|nr:hypothetical protein [Ferruginibacter sp. HRS2-29]MCP9750342.1 hypothetical protein [Ferruginibacter sp. HRS2-29]
MQGNNNNNNPGWERKLEGLESLSGEDFDLSASWEKLEARRENPPRKNKAAWYWLAAACLLAVISLPWFFTGKSKNEAVVKENIPVKQTEQFILKEQPDTSHAVAVAVSNEVKVIARPAAALIISSNNQPPVPKNNVLPEEIVPDIASVQPVIADTFHLIAAAPAKKKLKMVHYNELAGSTDSLTGDGRPYFPVKFHTKEIYTNNAGNRKDNLIRIKLSSQN